MACVWCASPHPPPASHRIASANPTTQHSRPGQRETRERECDVCVYHTPKAHPKLTGREVVGEMTKPTEQKERTKNKAGRQAGRPTDRQRKTAGRSVRGGVRHSVSDGQYRERGREGGRQAERRGKMGRVRRPQHSHPSTDSQTVRQLRKQQKSHKTQTRTDINHIMHAQIHPPTDPCAHHTHHP